MMQLVDNTVIISEIFTVKNDRGLHTRPATEIVKCTAAFDADIMLSYQKLEVNAKSILGILMLTAGRGARIRITANGHDAAEAVQALLDLAEKKFNIKY
jgi:phosphocarrier protein HPr